MPQITAALSIANGAATPVAKTFSPERVSPELSQFAERTASSSAGYVRLTVKFSAATSKRPTNRVDVELDLPVLQNIGGVDSVAHTGRFKGYFVVPDAMASSNRADLHAFVANALANSAVKAVVKDLDPMY